MPLPRMEFDPEKLTKTFAKAAQQVFFDMLAEGIELKECVAIAPEDPPERAAPSHYGIGNEMHCVHIDFTGDFNGELFLYFNMDLARAITRQFLEINEVGLEDLEDCIQDILGEISNMMAGLIKNSLLHTNFKCLLGLPKHLRNRWVTFEETQKVAFRNLSTFAVLGDTMVGDLVFYGMA